VVDLADCIHLDPFWSLGSFQSGLGSAHIFAYPAFSLEFISPPFVWHEASGIGEKASLPWLARRSPCNLCCLSFMESFYSLACCLSFMESSYSLASPSLYR